MLLGYGGIQPLRDRIDDPVILDRHKNGIPQILIPLDMCRYADLVDDLRHLHLQRLLRLRIPPCIPAHRRRRMIPAQRQDTLRHLPGIKRLQEIIIRPCRQRLPLQRRIVKAGHNHHTRALGQLQSIQSLQHTDGIQPGQKKVQQHHVRLLPDKGIQ